MTPPETTTNPAIARHFLARLDEVQRETDRIFLRLLLGEWAFCCLTALVVSPRAWTGEMSSVHIHVWAALGLGGLLVSLPLGLIALRPGRPETRLVVAASQAMFSSLIIHLMGGRIEAHFHIFGSLAVLAAYRDPWVFLPAVLLTVFDHLFRGFYWPESVYGVELANLGRTLEHGGWVLFETGFLLWGIAQSRSHLWSTSSLNVALSTERDNLEGRIAERTRELEVQGRQLAQAQKLESIGQLAAGIAHEINTPMQCVASNIEFLLKAWENLFSVEAAYRDALGSTARSWEERQAAVSEAIRSARLDFVRTQAPQALGEANDAIQRVIETVRAMRAMSHPGSREFQPTDINKLVQSAATIARNRWKQVAVLRWELQADLPHVPALGAELSQVLLNLIVNAADALAEKLGDRPDEPGVITVRTVQVEAGVRIEIADTGTGIPEEIRDRIFDPFFTTKDVGKGTGQGLAIAYDVVVNKHGGRLSVSSTPGEGSTFTIDLSGAPADAAPPVLPIHAPQLEAIPV